MCRDSAGLMRCRLCRYMWGISEILAVKVYVGD